MPIENELKRIADSLEKLAYHFTNQANGPATDSMPSLDMNGFEPNTSQPPVDAPKSRTKKSTAITGVSTPAVDLPGETVPTMEDLIDVLREVVGSKGPEVARPILKKYGAAKISEVATRDYIALRNDLKASLK